MTDQEREITVSVDPDLRRRVDVFLVIIASVAAVFVLPVAFAVLGQRWFLPLVFAAVAVGGLTYLVASQRDHRRPVNDAE